MIQPAMREQNIKNIKTEKDGIVLLKRKLDSFFVPTKDQKLKLYEIAGVDYKQFSKSIDGVISEKGDFADIKTIDDFQFIEIKTTRSATVKNCPTEYFLALQKTKRICFGLYPTTGCALSTSPWTNTYRVLSLADSRLARFPAYVSLSQLTTKSS